MNSLGRLLPSLVRSADDSPDARECAAFTAWNGAVGAGVRRASAPVRLEGRFLIVAVVDQTWKTQLQRLADQLIFKVNSLLGAPVVTRIVFRVDPSAVSAYNWRDDRPFSTGDPAACARALSAEAAAIPDPELREAFLRAASKCLARTEEEEKGRR
jgi:hypothetical protein